MRDENCLPATGGPSKMVSMDHRRDARGEAAPALDKRPGQGSGYLHYSDADFVRFEEALKRGGSREAVWRRRVGIYLSLIPPLEQRKRFRFGVSGILAEMLRDWARSKRRASPIPPADFFFLIFGALSKEYDSLKPVASALSERGHSVTVLWVVDGREAARERLENWGGARVVLMSRADLLGGARIFPVGAWCRALKVGLQALLALAREAEFRRALWKQRARVASRLVNEELWARFYASRLKTFRYRGVAFAADTSEPGAALAEHACKQGWASHHFLHGFANLVHTRTLAERVYCFSEPEREFFVDAGWPGDHVFADGHPRQQSIISEIEKRRTTVPNAGGLRVLFANQGVDGDYDEGHHAGTMEAVFTAISRLGLAPAGFRIRLHPSANRAFDLGMCGRHSIDPGCVSSRPVAEDLAWCNVLITPWSTMAVEAAYAGCALIWIAVGTFQFAVRERLIAAGYGEKAATAEGLVALLQRMADESVRARQIEALQQKSRELGIINQRAADAAAERMEAAG